ncbi:MAG: hypothetical protein ACRDUB_14820, partial [Mycobacterium sp.]
MRGGDDVVSRVRVAAAACLMASGLFVGGAGGALAFASPEDGESPGGGEVASGSTGAAAPDTVGSAPAEGAVGTGPDRRGRSARPPRVIIGNGRDTTPSDAGESAPEGKSSKQSENAGGSSGTAPGAPAGEQPRDPGDPTPSAPGVATVGADPDPGLAAAAPPNPGDPGAENPQGPEDPE